MACIWGQILLKRRNDKDIINDVHKTSEELKVYERPSLSFKWSKFKLLRIQANLSLGAYL